MWRAIADGAVIATGDAYRCHRAAVRALAAGAKVWLVSPGGVARRYWA